MRQVPKTRFDIHEAIKNGIPTGALTFVFERTIHIPPGKLADAIGVRVRTVRRRASSPLGRLNQNQSGHLWKFAEILHLATEAIGDQAGAERWLCSPRPEIDQRAPIDLLRTIVGAEIVEELLMRLARAMHASRA